MEISVLMGSTGPPPPPPCFPLPPSGATDKLAAGFNVFSGKNVKSLCHFTEQDARVKNTVPSSWRLPGGTQDEVTKQRVCCFQTMRGVLSRPHALDPIKLRAPGPRATKGHLRTERGASPRPCATCKPSRAGGGPPCILGRGFRRHREGAGM